MKTYTDTQKKSILAKLDKAPKGKFMDAVKASGVSYATIRIWKLRKGEKKPSTSKPAVNKRVVAELFQVGNDLNKTRNKFIALLKRL